MTRTLLLMRHAEAAAGLLGTDHDRELTARGHAGARAAGTRLARLGGVDLAIVSSAVRTRQTLEGLREGGLAVAAADDRAEVYEAAVPTLLATVRSAPAGCSTLLVVGHSPGIPGLATVLANDPAAPWPTVRMPKGFAPATVVRLEVDGEWADLAPGGARLLDVLVP